MTQRKRLGYYAGQRLKAIDWEQVNDLLDAGCTGHEVAAVLSISYDCLIHRCAQEKGIDWKDYRKIYDNVGKTRIRKLQRQKCEQGSDTMLKWVGQVRLDQLQGNKGFRKGNIQIVIKYFVIDENDVAREVATEDDSTSSESHVYIDDAESESDDD